MAIYQIYLYSSRSTWSSQEKQTEYFCKVNLVGSALLYLVARINRSGTQLKARMLLFVRSATSRAFVWTVHHSTVLYWRYITVHYCIISTVGKKMKMRVCSRGSAEWGQTVRVWVYQGVGRVSVLMIFRPSPGRLHCLFTSSVCWCCQESNMWKITLHSGTNFIFNVKESLGPFKCPVFSLLRRPNYHFLFSLSFNWMTNNLSDTKDQGKYSGTKVKS